MVRTAIAAKEMVDNNILFTVSLFVSSNKDTFLWAKVQEKLKRFLDKTDMRIWMQKLTFNTKIGNQMQNLYCRNVRNVKFPKIGAEKFAFYNYCYQQSNTGNYKFAHIR